MKIIKTKDYFAKLSSYRYATNIITIFSSLIYSFLVANILGPENYGTISYVLAFLINIPSLLGFVAINELIIVYTAKFNSKKLFKKTFTATLVLLGLITILVILLANSLTAFLNKGTVEIIHLASILIILSPLSVLFQSFFSGLKKFGFLLKAIIIEKFITISLIIILLVFLKQGLLAIIYTNIIVYSVMLVIYTLTFRKQKLAEKKLPKEPIKKFLKQSTFANILKAFSSQLDLWLIGTLLTPFSLGVMYLIKRFTTYIYESSQMAIAEVAFPFLSEIGSEKQKLENYTTFFLKAQVILNVILSVAFLIGVTVVINVFFPQYTGGIIILPILTVGYLFSVSMPLTRLIKSINKNNLLYNGFIISIMLSLILGFTLIPTYGLIGAAIVIMSQKIIFSEYMLFIVKKQGYNIKVIPSIKDLRFFYSILKELAKNTLKKIS